MINSSLEIDLKSFINPSFTNEAKPVCNFTTSLIVLEEIK